MLDHVTELLASVPEGEDENQEEENGDLEEEELDSTSSGDEEMDTQWQWIHERPLQELREVRWLVYIFTKKISSLVLPPVEYSDFLPRLFLTCCKSVT